MWTLSPLESEAERIRCEVCRGLARFCKLTTCPYYKDLLSRFKVRRELEGIIYGPSPPNVIVGEKGYPLVNVGLSLSLTEELDPVLSEKPRAWLERDMMTLLRARLSLMLGRNRSYVTDVRRNIRLLETVQLASLSQRPVDLEVVVRGPFNYRPIFLAREFPYGPSAKVVEGKVVSDAKAPRKVEQLVNDFDVSANEAVIELDEHGINEYYVTRLFSAGMLGKERKLVPTEWSITAVDDIISKNIIKEIKDYPVISDYYLFSHSALYNSAHVLLAPMPWAFELLEGWLKYPEESPYNDYELLKPRTTYAESTGGAYYAVRLAVARKLLRSKRQAAAIVFFEVEPGWIPLGVWRFREITRLALEKPPEKFDRLSDALAHLKPRLKLDFKRYISKSALIRFITSQRRLGEYAPPI